MPEPKRPSARARHPLVIAGSAVFSLMLIVALAGGLAVNTAMQRLDMPGPLDRDMIVDIRSSGVRDIADLLQQKGVIDQWWVFLSSAVVRKARGEKLQAGEYEFKKQASLSQVIDTLIDGKVVQHHLTIPEGLTSEQIVERLMDNDVLKGNIKEIPKEGSLLPETYNFTRGFTREQMVQRMQQSQRKLVQEIWDRHAPELPIESADQLVVLASIIEKETGKPEERSRVSAVFVNRLKQRIKLQSDPTIVYGLAPGKGTLGRPISQADIQRRTAYNTYVIDGLPPGPIANPGRASLEAAAAPARTKELFFVADGSGGHAFAETLDQHKKNVERLRQIERQQKEGLNEPPAEPQPPQGSPPIRPPAGQPVPAARSGTPRPAQGANTPRSPAGQPPAAFQRAQ